MANIAHLLDTSQAVCKRCNLLCGSEMHVAPEHAGLQCHAY